MDLGEFADQFAAPLERVFAAMFDLVREEPSEDPIAILNPPATSLDLREAEERTGVTLHPLHRVLLQLSDGGTLPFVMSVGYMAGTVRREEVWHYHSSSFEWADSPGESVQGDDATIEPLILGQSLADAYGGVRLERFDFDSFVMFASGYDGEFFGYARGYDGRIDVVSQDFGRGIEAVDFDAFVRRQLLANVCESPSFVERIRRLLSVV